MPERRLDEEADPTPIDDERTARRLALSHEMQEEPTELVFREGIQRVGRARLTRRRDKSIVVRHHQSAIDGRTLTRGD